MKAYLSVGSNLGEREKNLRDSLQCLSERAGKLIAISPVYETEPVGFITPDLFLNQVAILETTLQPSELLILIKKIEISLGRIRNEDRYISRTIDMDILFCEDLIINNDDLVVPHPRMHERRFVLEPLCDIAPGFIHPVFRLSVKELFERLSDNNRVVRLK